MAESTPIQRVQFGEEIHPVKSTGVYSSTVREASLSEKNEDVNFEERAVQIADADANRKKKQVCHSH